jgi:hypothetical protein
MAGLFYPTPPLTIVLKDILSGDGGQVLIFIFGF